MITVSWSHKCFNWSVTPTIIYYQLSYGSGDSLEFTAQPPCAKHCAEYSNALACKPCSNPRRHGQCAQQQFTEAQSS